MRKATSREDILNAATVVAAREGASRLTIDAVAREVGLSKAGLLYSFPSKEALLTALLTRVIDKMEENAPGDDVPISRVCYDADGVKVEKPHLRHDMRIFRHFLQDDTDLPRAILIAGAQNPELLDPFRAFLGAKMDRVCTQACDSILALVLVAAMDGLMFQHLLKLPPVEPEIREKILERIEQMFEELETWT